MRLIIILFLLLSASPGLAQSSPVPGWNPVADYVTAGQDEPGYRRWVTSASWRPVYVKAFHEYLTNYGVGGVAPTWQLLRTATAWQRCAGQPFEIPPTSEWPHIVQTLRYIRDYVVPAVGPVEPVSGYRNPNLNNCAGGAQESAHKYYSAIDLVPLRPTTREQLMQTLCAAHGRRGPAYEVGLGFYAFLRFHVDTAKYRRWNMDPAVASHCPPIVRPSDIASVGQPLPPQQPAAAATSVVVPTSQPPRSDVTPPVPPPLDPLAPKL